MERRTFASNGLETMWAEIRGVNAINARNLPINICRHWGALAQWVARPEAFEKEVDCLVRECMKLASCRQHFAQSNNPRKSQIMDAQELTALAALNRLGHKLEKARPSKWARDLGWN